jgi:uncharacterized metal-binding protein YceD (DUF177 family)
MKHFQFDIRNLPDDGKRISGTEPPAFFNLTEKDNVKPLSQLEYDLDIIRDGKDIVVTGRLGATFELQCGRCLEEFAHRVEMGDYQAEVPIEKETTMDLTDMVREDILLALPNFPRCEDGNINPRQCPAEGKFDPAEPSEEADEMPGADRGVWDALDKLK